MRFRLITLTCVYKDHKNCAQSERCECRCHTRSPLCKLDGKHHKDCSGAFVVPPKQARKCTCTCHRGTRSVC